jgi:site-specific recombinase XerD
MSSGDANLHMARYQARLGIAREGRSIHTFRHSVAGMLTATGQVPFLVMDALGHRTVSTSKYYSNLASEYQRIIAAERWPVGVLLLRKTSLGAK